LVGGVTYASAAIAEYSGAWLCFTLDGCVIGNDSRVAAIFLVPGMGASMIAVGAIEGTAEGTVSFAKILSGASSDGFGQRTHHGPFTDKAID